MSNTFGRLFRLTTFGESHGTLIGGVVDGFPAGFPLNLDKVQDKLNLRKPGSSNLVSERNENDIVEFHSGLIKNITIGSPIAFIIKNKDNRSKDYNNLKEIFRPSHADFTYQKKYGIRDPYGGGRSSARETACRVVAGSLASQYLTKKGISIYSYVSSIGNIELNKKNDDLDLSNIYKNRVFCPDKSVALKMENLIKEIKEKGDTVGGCVTTVIKGVSPGLGEPVYNKLNARLSFAMMSINAAKGIEFGSGFKSTKMIGSEHNDIFIKKDNSIKTKTNNSGGVQGGISNGEDVCFRVAFKPVSSIQKKQQTVNNKNQEVSFLSQGRHDPCVVSRAVPIVECMTSIVLMDMYLLNLISK